jgi:AcrR family transcriptional regulator
MNPDSDTARPVRLRDRLRDEANRAILDAAEEVFSEEGLAARMERIAARAGVAVGTLYNHFQDRQALVEALSCSRKETLFRRLEARMAETEGRSIRERLRAVLGAIAEHGKAHGRYLSMLVQAGEGPARAHPKQTFVTELVARTEQILDQAIAAGELRPEGREVYAVAFVGMIRAANVAALEGRTTWEALTEQLLDLFLEGAAR